MKNYVLSFCCLLLISIFSISCVSDRSKDVNVAVKDTIVNNDNIDTAHRSNPLVDGYVPDEVTAIKIAEAVWLPIYGKEIYDYQPFKAIIVKDSIWEVSGTIHSSLGGSPFAYIKKKDGKILDVYHEE